ncbi:MAG: peptidylprolyl isomerase [Hydrogenophilales bacterium]|nr:peptidylprolyl isomerase [Hydrogenophilales bacterium]
MKSNSPKHFPLAMLLATVLSAPVAAAPQSVDHIVAVVNDAVITQYELNTQVQRITAQLARNTPTPPPRRALEKQVLERMITEKSLLQTAEATNIRIDNAALNRALTRLASQNNMDLPDFKAALEKEGQDYAAFREQVRNEMTITRLREREVDAKIIVTESELDNFLANPSLNMDHQTEYNLAHILILAPEGATPEKLRELQDKAAKALAELNGGANFAQVSAIYSDAQNAMQGGTLGWRPEAKLPSLFASAVKSLAAGETTPVLRSANGFHILRVIDKRGKDVNTVVKQTLARHILIKINEIVTDQDAQKRLAELRDRIANGAEFDRLAKVHSDDGSASKGGDLGWLSPGETVPEFERAMNSLKPGELSEPVRSAFGWHLIQVMERRDKDVTQERKRMDARRAIMERKSDEAFDDWVRQTRDRAYVEYRLEE